MAYENRRQETIQTSWPEWAALDLIIASQQEWQSRGMSLLRCDLPSGADESAKVALGYQVHGDSIALIDKNNPLFQFEKDIRLPRTDAMILTGPGVIGGVLTADCVPVAILDEANRRLALVHAGWRGTMFRIVAKTLRLMARDGGDLSKFRVWIGPCIRRESYEVSQDLAEQFATAFPKVKNAVTGRLLDLAVLNAWQAKSMGVPEGAIEDCGVDTFIDNRFPSYRREGAATGRILTRGMIRGL